MIKIWYAARRPGVYHVYISQWASAGAAKLCNTPGLSVSLRSLLDPTKGADLGADLGTGLGGDPEHATLLLDFNMAYPPSCAYDPRWACPLAPPDTYLSRPVRVGERLAVTGG